jgi:hypothetical protein
MASRRNNVLTSSTESGSFPVAHNIARPKKPPLTNWTTACEPLFRWAFEGCHVTRDIPALVRQGGFLIEEIKEGYVSPLPKSGWYCWCGVAAANPKTETPR